MGTRAAAAVPDLRALGRACMGKALAAAGELRLSEAVGALEVLARSYFVKTDPLAEEAVQKFALAIPVQREQPHPSVDVTVGELTFTGPLSEVVRRLLQREAGEHAALFRGCYFASDALYARASGEVKVRMALDTSARFLRAEGAESSFDDTGLRDCVVHVIENASGTPTRAAHEVRVVVPVRFTVPER
jgi:hypothetical protein